MSPDVLRLGPYQFRFTALDRGEPRHIHVWRGRSHAKFWLDPVTLVVSHHFSKQELRDIERLVTQHAEIMRERWDEYFSD